MKIEDLTPDHITESRTKLTGAGDLMEKVIDKMLEDSEKQFGGPATDLASITMGASLLAAGFETLYRRAEISPEHEIATKLVNDEADEVMAKLGYLLEQFRNGGSTQEILTLSKMLASTFAKPVQE